jgi:hypothetical protein
VCDASSVDFENDAVPGDIVQADRVTENLQIHFNENQRWYYLQDQMPSEMLVLKNADSGSEHGATWGKTPKRMTQLDTTKTAQVRLMLHSIYHHTPNGKG